MLTLLQNITSEVPTFDTNANIEALLIEPVWSSNENIDIDISSLIVSLEGPTNIVEFLLEIIPFSVFKILWTDEIITYITYFPR